MARKAMREELARRSRTLKVASRAMRQALRARRARSSAPRSLGSAVDLAGRGVGSASSVPIFRDVGAFRGIGRKGRARGVDAAPASSLVPKCESMVTTLSRRLLPATGVGFGQARHGGQLREPCRLSAPPVFL